MNNWITINTDTLNEASIADLVTALDSAALASGQAGRATGIIQGIVDDVRLRIASSGKNRWDEDETKIPKGLRDLCVDLIIARLKKALEIPLSKDESDALERHEARLRRIADGREVVDAPDAPETPQTESAGKIEVVGTPTRQATRDKLAGL